jgi:hypothetical protein
MLEEKQNWYFSFGCGQVNHGHYIKLFGTRAETREKMFNIYEDKWSMQYSEIQWQNPSEDSIRFNNLNPKDKPTMAQVWGWKEIK